MKNLAFNINRIIFILNKIFIQADSYKILSTKYDDVNEQLDIFVNYNISDDDGIYNSTFIVGIPDYIMNSKCLNTDIDSFIEVMAEIVNNDYNQLIYGEGE